MKISACSVKPRRRVSLSSRAASLEGSKAPKEKAEKFVPSLLDYRQMLAASGARSLLVILQGMDASGKDGMVRRLFAPAGFRAEDFHIASFWARGAGRTRSDFLAPFRELMPSSGGASVFNRSYYEHVLLDRVHPELLDDNAARAPKERRALWKRRYRAINDLERELSESGCIVLKFFLHVSKDEQKHRLLERIMRPEKQHKFDPVHDMDARRRWNAYQKAYEEALSRTSTRYARWHIIPADDKNAAQVLVAKIILRHLRRRGLRFPKLSGKRYGMFVEAKEALEYE